MSDHNVYANCPHPGCEFPLCDVQDDDILEDGTVVPCPHYPVDGLCPSCGQPVELPAFVEKAKGEKQ